MKKTIDEQLDEIDWRLHCVFRGFPTDPTKSIFNKESVFNLSGRVKFGSDILNFDLPNISALYLDISYKDFTESSNYLVFRNFNRSYNGDREPNNYNEFIYFLQKRVSSIFFAYSALDAFIDEQIKVDIEYNHSSYKKTEKILNKEGVSKLPIDIRLWKVLPSVLKIETCDIEIYKIYKEFKLLRDRLIHPKMIDRRSTSINDDSLWSYLINKDVVNYAIQIKQIIEYFSKNMPKEQEIRWLKKIPF